MEPLNQKYYTSHKRVCAECGEEMVSFLDESQPRCETVLQGNYEVHYGFVVEKFKKCICAGKEILNAKIEKK